MSDTTSDTWIVRMPTWLGDNILALPTLRALRRAHRGRLVAWGPPAYRDLWSAAAVDVDYLPYRRRRGAAGISDALRAVAALKGRGASTILMLPNAFEPAALAALAGIPRRIGYATDGRARLLTRAVAPPARTLVAHEGARFEYLLDTLGVDAPTADDHRVNAGAALVERSADILPAGNDFVGIVAGSANAPAKRWPAASFAALIDDAARRCSAGAVLLGSEADGGLNGQIGEQATADSIDLSGGDLVDLAAALLRCRVVVSNDTGAAHLAAALGTPVILLYGPTDPQRTLPRGEQVTAMTAGAFCQPCEYSQCPLDHRCMSELSVGVIADQVATFWRAGA